MGEVQRRDRGVSRRDFEALSPSITNVGQSRSASWQARNSVPSETAGTSFFAPNPNA